jgi:GNAT superfamily N-acetyltransferase
VAGDEKRRGAQNASMTNEYRLSEDPAELDMERVFDWLSRRSYWALGRARDVVERSFAGSYPVGLYAGTELVAVARIVSDRATFAWLCDVYVDERHRGRGLGTRLAGWATDWARRHGVPRIILATKDAHGVYAAAGFQPFRSPERWMEIDRRNLPADLH